MNRIIFLLASMIFLSANQGWAQDPTVSTQTPQERNHDLGDERIGLKPEIGYLAYQDPIVGSATRGTAGIGADFNFAPAWKSHDTHMAIQTGIFDSIIGQPGGDFYGANSNYNIGSSSDYLLTIPADLKIGYNVANAVRISAHGGGNVIYRSNNTTVDLGTGANNGASDWNLFPNAGLDAEVGLSRHVNLLIRPDWTFTAASAFFIGTLGVDFAID